mmetsp:Transcript_25337/g.62748  ORF Transcript_25337/g.62748 Transcript_25337/m.62748 type:complete len:211 (-) Transcript_25337:436-1068(-)
MRRLTPLPTLTLVHVLCRTQLEAKIVISLAGWAPMSECVVATKGGNTRDPSMYAVSRGGSQIHPSIHRPSVSPSNHACPVCVPPSHVSRRHFPQQQTRSAAHDYVCSLLREMNEARRTTATPPGFATDRHQQTNRTSVLSLSLPDASQPATRSHTTKETGGRVKLSRRGEKYTAHTALDYTPHTGWTHTHTHTPPLPVDHRPFIRRLIGR